MPIVVTPEIGIPLPVDVSPEEIEDFRQQAHLLFQTVETLSKQGLEVQVTEQDRQEARSAFAASAMPALPKTTPGTIVHLEALLNEWDHEILDSSRRLRNYVTNKLVMESSDPDPRIRLKALELLGKVSEVGLFSERVDISVTHRSMSDIETELKKALELFTGNTIDVTPLEEVAEAVPKPKTLADIDIDAELGIPVEATSTSHEPAVA